MTYSELKEQNEKLKIEIDSYHMFYEDFDKYDVAISNANGILIDMYSNTIKAKKNNPNNIKVTEQEERIKSLLSIFEMMQGLNSKAQKLKLRFRHLNNRLLNLDQELTAIKKAHSED